MATVKKLYLDIEAKTAKAEEGVQKLDGMFKKVALTAAAMFAVDKVVDFGKESIGLYGEQIEQETKLAAVVKTHMGNMKDLAKTQQGATEELKQHASLMQNQTTYGDEIQLRAMENYTTFGLQGKEVEKLNDAQLDLAAHMKGTNATSEDMLGLSNMIGKAVVNSAAALAKSGTLTKEQVAHIDAIKDRSEKVNAIAQAIKENYGGQAAALTKTATGAMKQTENSWGDTQEKVGEIESKLLQGILPSINKMLTWLQNNIVPMSKALFGWVKKNSDTLKTILDITVAVIAAWKTYVAVMQISKGILWAIMIYQNATKEGQTILNGLTAVWNAIMLLNPISWIAIAIAAVVGVIVLIIMKTHSWNAVLGGVKAIFLTIWEIIKGVWNTVKWIVDGIGNVAKGIGGFIGHLFGSNKSEHKTTVNLHMDGSQIGKSVSKHTSRSGVNAKYYN